jgi:DNA-binding transcriptional ArsR family regulator
MSAVTVEAEQSVTIGAGAGPLRRTLGPTAWLVFEELLLRSDTGLHDGDRVVSTSVRQIGTSLGLAKDTVARALRRLSDEGLVEYAGSREHDGRFGPSHYRLVVPRGVFLETATTRTAAPKSTGPSQRNLRSRAPAHTQLSLIDVADTAS